MNNIAKVCPHCRTQLKSETSVFELARRGTVGPEHTAGLPVTVFSCPKCGYMELYNLRVSGRL